MRCVRALRETRERRNINSGRFCGADVRLNGAGHELTHDRLRHDALHLGGHGACCREASETGARRGAAYCGRASRVSGKLRPSLDVPQVPVTRDKSRTESARAVEWRSRLARRVRRPSPSTVRQALKERSARMGIHSGLPVFPMQFSTRSPRELANLFLGDLLLQPRARPHARHEDAPLTALRLSGAMGGSRNSGRRVGGGGLGSVRPCPFLAPRCRHARPPPPPPGFPERARGLSTPRLTPPPPLRAFPHLDDDRVSRARLPATARTSAATTGDTSSRATTATSRMSIPTARSDRICAR